MSPTDESARRNVGMGMRMEKIYRLQYRAKLNREYLDNEINQVVEECKENIRRLQAEGRLLTAALYYYGRQLFLYYEALGMPLEVVEPINWEQNVAKGAEKNGKEIEMKFPVGILEQGEDIQTTALHPKEFLAPLSPYLMVWPGQQEDRLWVHMYHIYHHDVPESVEQWERAAVPEERKGRIAFLREEKLFSYVYYHKAIVDEGLLQGDKYQCIALHENLLFSYFEEPKTIRNICDNMQEASMVINDWIGVDPDSHFIHMSQGGGENFMFLPALFALGVEDTK